MKEEIKSKKFQMLIKPSVYDGIKELADKNGDSVNNYINELLEEHVFGSQDYYSTSDVMRETGKPNATIWGYAQKAGYGEKVKGAIRYDKYEFKAICDYFGRLGK